MYDKIHLKALQFLGSNPNKGIEDALKDTERVGSTLHKSLENLGEMMDSHTVCVAGWRLY